MNIVIRNEREEDFRQVEEITREAFWNLYVPGCDEHYLAHQMRTHPDFIKELDFVAETDGKIIGSIMYSKSQLICDSGEKKEIVSFGPLCVHPDYQRQGIGTKLINHTVNILRAKGVEAIAIYGSPYNYCKHGFKNGKDFNISDMNGNFPYGLLVLELKKGAFDHKKWKCRQSNLFNIDQIEAELFDRSFPDKEKEYRYSQEIFSISIRSFLK